MRKINLLLPVLAAAVISSSAVAENLELDQDGNGTFITVNALGLAASPDTYTLTQFLGADGIFNDGDTFTESAQFNVGSYINGSGLDTPLLNKDLYDMAAGSELAMHLTADLSGFVSNVAAPSAAILAAAITAADLADDNIVNGSLSPLDIANLQFALTSFTINFDSGIVKLFLDDNNGDFNTFNTTTFGPQISQWNNLVGKGDAAAAVNGTRPSTDFGFDMDFDSAWFQGAGMGMGDRWRHEDDTPVISGPDWSATSVAFINSSAQPQRVTGFIPDGGDVGTAVDGFIVEVKDNRGIVTFAEIPEPSSIAILGLGLLGLAGARRRAK
jgi:hypothetical protein